MPMLINFFLTSIWMNAIDSRKTEIRCTIDSYITYDLLLIITKMYSFRK